jgi:hypothetical protein
MTDHPRCRFCATPLTETFVDLGEMPLANSFLTKDEPDPTAIALSCN